MKSLSSTSSSEFGTPFESAHRFGERGGFAARTEEVAEPRRLAQGGAGLDGARVLGVGEVRLDHEVTRVQLFGDDLALAALQLGHALERNQDLGNHVLEPLHVDARLELLADGVLAAGLAANEIPLVAH